MNNYRKLILNLLLVSVIAGMLMLTKTHAQRCGEEPVTKNGLHEIRATELVSLKFL